MGQHPPRKCPRCKGINPGCSEAQQKANWPQCTSTWYSYTSWLSWNKIQLTLSFKAWFIHSLCSKITAVSRNFIFFLHQCNCTRIMWMLLHHEKVLWTLRTQSCVYMILAKNPVPQKNHFEKHTGMSLVHQAWSNCSKAEDCFHVISSKMMQMLHSICYSIQFI